MFEKLDTYFRSCHSHREATRRFRPLESRDAQELDLPTILIRDTRKNTWKNSL